MTDVMDCYLLAFFLLAIAVLVLLTQWRMEAAKRKRKQVDFESFLDGFCREMQEEQRRYLNDRLDALETLLREEMLRIIRIELRDIKERIPPFPRQG